jgi:hypothetical protein
MNETAWQELYQSSQKLTKASHVKGLIDQKNLAEYHDLIKNALHEFVTNRELHTGLKIYLEKVLTNEYHQILKEAPLPENDTIENWLEKTFKEQPFGMVLNFIETLSDEFACKAVAEVQPLLELAGLPLGGLSFLGFIGNYGFTPFGIHKESPGEEGFLFHLGPGIKKFYVWETEAYNQIPHNTQVFHDIEERLSDAKCFILEPGDAVFIPHHTYHIADTPEFSLSFTMDYINPPIDVVEKEILHRASEIAIDFTNGNYYQPLSSEEKNWNELLSMNSINNRLEEAMQDFILCLKSNTGVKRPSLKNHKIQMPNGNARFQAVNPFPLFLKKRGDKSIIFARGHLIKTNSHPFLEKMIDAFNQEKVVTMDQLKTGFSPDWSMVDIYGVLSSLMHFNAVKLIENN